METKLKIYLLQIESYQSNHNIKTKKRTNKTERRNTIFIQPKIFRKTDMSLSPIN